MISGTSASIAKFLFVLFIILFVLSLIFGPSMQGTSGLLLLSSFA